jgi:hypothetical protein
MSSSVSTNDDLSVAVGLRVGVGRMKGSSRVLRPEIPRNFSSGVLKSRFRVTHAQIPAESYKNTSSSESSMSIISPASLQTNKTSI